MSGWGNSWNKLPELKQTETYKIEYSGPNMFPEINHVELFVDTIPQFLNNKPTHDPYTNPNSHIYYECGCGAIFDPGTKSFAQLNNCASEAGWKIRWGADSYVPYCLKCGEGVE